MTATKKESFKLNTINGFDIYIDPSNGRFFFTLKTTGKERVEFATMRAAEEAARGDVSPINVIVVGHDRYQHPEVVEIIGMSGWNLVTKDHKRLSLYQVFSYDESLLARLNAAADACAKAHQQWNWVIEDFKRLGHTIDVDPLDNWKTIEGEHKRAEGGVLRIG